MKKKNNKKIKSFELGKICEVWLQYFITKI